MKKFILSIAGLLALIIITACAYQQDNNETPARPIGEDRQPTVRPSEADPQYRAPRAYWRGLHMYVTADSITPTGLQLSMINSEGQSFGHGVMFSIEQHTVAGWQQVPFVGDVFWILPLLSVGPYMTMEERITWEHMHGPLPPGQYRIVRNFMGFDDQTQMWERDIPETYLYAIFTIQEDWQEAHARWQTHQDTLAATAYARFEGLDLEITEYSSTGLSFTLTNNNSYYTYIIQGAFVGWEDTYGGAAEYFIFSQGFENKSWPFGYDKRLHPGEALALDVDWYYERGCLTISWGMQSSNPYVFELVMMVSLDVDEEYINQHFRHAIPGLPGMGHRIKASFDISRHYRP